MWRIRRFIWFIALPGMLLAVACTTVLDRDTLPRTGHLVGPTGNGTSKGSAQGVSVPPQSNGQIVERWTKLPVTYCVSNSPDGFVTPREFAAAADQAFATWGVPAHDVGSCDGEPQANDNANEIGWGHLQNADTVRAGVFEAGVTQIRYRECSANCSPSNSGELLEADVTIDENPPDAFRSRECLESTLLHETGHFLGLDHLPPPAIMAAETSGCSNTLTSADIAALRERYGDEASVAP